MEVSREGTVGKVPTIQESQFVRLGTVPRKIEVGQGPGGPMMSIRRRQAVPV